MLRVRASVLAIVLFGAVPAAGQEDTRVCFSPARMRTAITEHKLADPFALLGEVARRARAEPLTSRLCKVGEGWVYEMTLLPRSGKVTRIYVNAVDGGAVEKDW